MHRLSKTGSQISAALPPEVQGALRGLPQDTHARLVDHLRRVAYTTLRLEGAPFPCPAPRPRGDPNGHAKTDVRETALFELRPRRPTPRRHGHHGRALTSRSRTAARERQWFSFRPPLRLPPILDARRTEGRDFDYAGPPRTLDEERARRSPSTCPRLRAHFAARRRRTAYSS